MGSRLTASDRIVAFLSDWHRRTVIVAGLPGVAHLDGQLVTLLKAGRLIRRGQPRGYEYKANPEWQRKRAWGGREQQVSAPAFHDMEPIGKTPALSPSIGVVCVAPPLNASQGRIEDAIAAVLTENMVLPLQDLLSALPAGWSRAAAVSAISDGVLDGWIGSVGNAPHAHFQLRSTPPPPQRDHLADRFDAMRLCDQLVAIEQDLTAGLEEIRRCGLVSVDPPLSGARSEIRRAIRLLSA